MFDYKYTVKSLNNEFGLFKTKTSAQLMLDALIFKFGDMDDFWIEEIK
jgi:hypothetical protein